MNVKNIKIKEHQYLSDVIKKIATNSFYTKPTGSGITTMEIEAKRNSLILESNRPVIRGKALKYNGRNTRRLRVRPVHEGIEVQDIINYLKSDIEYKKIITTPESYPKVLKAFEEIDKLDIFFKEYFFLFDECERTIQDIDYRDTIILPINDFFKFKNKAFVSATPIIPSDPRFAKQRFQHVKVEPDYDYTQDCRLIVSNNTLYSLEKVLNENKAKQYFIFLNSTKAITVVIKYLNLMKESLIFCSAESKNKLILNGFENAHENLVTSDKFATYNFFTSRFNSAVDINDVVDPNIIVITDLFLAEHTMVDPYSEVQQIIGRFRKPLGGRITRFLTHISNTSSELPSTSKEQILLDIETFKSLHKLLKKYSDAASSAFVKSVVDEMLTRSEFAKYINRDGTTNYFMIDNAIFNNKVNSYYQSKDQLAAVYLATKKFNLSTEYQQYELTDEHKAKLKSASNLQSSLELILPVLNALEQEGLDKFDVQLQLKQIEKDHPTAFKAFKVVGFAKAVELKFDYRKIMTERVRIESSSQHGHFGFLSYLQENFMVGESYTLKTIKYKLRAGLKKYNLTRLKPDIKLLETYFAISTRKYIETRKGTKKYGYTIFNYKHALKK